MGVWNVSVHRTTSMVRCYRSSLFRAFILSVMLTTCPTRGLLKMRAKQISNNVSRCLRRHDRSLMPQGLSIRDKLTNVGLLSQGLDTNSMNVTLILQSIISRNSLRNTNGGLFLIIRRYLCTFILRFTCCTNSLFCRRPSILRRNGLFVCICQLFIMVRVPFVGDRIPP